uniref:vitellogenin-like n=1 Tax=Myxine glutinosa TaxID=7769 RepID=UPI00358EE1F3
MMRLLLVVLALAAADAYIQKGKSYLYGYEATLMSGVPNAGFNRAGVKIHAKVEVIGLDHKEALIMVHQPEVLQYLDRWPGGAFSPISHSAEPLVREIQVPVKFKFAESSLVSEVFAPSDVSEEALNIVKGIINLFSFSYKKDKTPPQGQEAGLEGVCHTSYVVQEEGTSKKTIVSKTRDLDNCQQKIYTCTGAAYTETCPGCRMGTKHLRSTAIYTYTLADSEPQVIQDVEADEIHQFSPFFETEGSIVTQGSQKLTLISSEQASKGVHSASQKSRGGLAFRFPTDAVMLLTPVAPIVDKDRANQLEDTLRHLVENNQMEVHYDAPAKFLELAMIMRNLKAEELDGLWRKIHAQKDYRRWVLDALPAMATSEALSFVKKAVTSNYLTESEASSVLTSILHQVKVNKTAMDDAKALLDSPFVRAIPSIRKSVILAYGSMVNRFCAKTPVCNEDVLQPLNMLLTESSRKSLPHHSETILALKAIGNAGQPSSIRRILKYLPLKGKKKESSSPIIQVTAISALSNIAKKDPASVKQRVLQLFLDSTLAPELRIRAFSILMETRPGFVTLAVVAEKLKSEKNLQVASFAISYIHTVGRSPVPELRNMSMACNVIAKTIGSRFDKLGARYSKVFHTSLFKDNLNAGVMAKLFVLNSGDSFIPKGIVAKVRGYAGGVAADIVEVALCSKGLQQILQSYTTDSQKGSARERQMWINKRSSLQRESIDKLSNWKGIAEEQAAVTIHARVFGQVVVYSVLDKEEINDFIKTATSMDRPSPTLHSFISSFERGINALYTKALVGTEIRYMQPTSVGMLLDVSLYLSSIITSRADVRVTFGETLPPDAKLSDVLSASPEIIGVVSPSIAMRGVATVAVTSSLVQAGVQYHADIRAALPANIKARASIVEKNIKVSVKPSSGPLEAITSSGKMTVFVSNAAESKVIPVLPPSPPSYPRQMQPLTRSLPSMRHYHSHASPKSRPAPPPSHSEGHTIEEDVILTRAKVSRSQFCANMSSIATSVCVRTSIKNAAFVMNTPFYYLVGSSNCTLQIKQADIGSAVKQLDFEIQAGPEASSKIVTLLKFSDASSMSASSSGSSSESTSGNRFTGMQAKDTSSGSSPSWSMGRRHRASRFQSSRASDSEMRPSHSGVPFEDLRIIAMKFKPYTRSESRPSSSASSLPVSTSSAQTDDWGEHTAKEPIAVALAKVIREDRQPHGLQLAVYGSRSAPQTGLPRASVIVSDLNASSSWKLCAKAQALTPSRARSVLAWGSNCADYQLEMRTALGMLHKYPSARVDVSWARAPRWMKRASTMMYNRVTIKAYNMGMSKVYKANSPDKASVIVAAVAPRSLQLLVKVPWATFTKSGINPPIPIPLAPVDETSGLLESGVDGAGIGQLVEDFAVAVQSFPTATCSASGLNFTTFNQRNYNYSMPSSCKHILVQDCKENSAFTVYLKNVSSGGYELQVITKDSVITVRPASASASAPASASASTTGSTSQDVKALVVHVNGKELKKNLTTQGPESMVVNKTTTNSVIIKASNLGIDKIVFNGTCVNVTVNNKLMGRVCGLCGHNDGEMMNDLRMPNHNISSDPEVFGYSWALPDASCDGSCPLARVNVKVEGIKRENGEVETCYSKHSILRCPASCTPVDIISVKLGMHCLPPGSGPSMANSTSLANKSEDTQSMVEAHTLCECDAKSCKSE